MTLTEVLVALFVMAVGMLALLTLFPLGAFQIGQALKDDRTHQTALQGDAYVRALWRHHVVAPLDGGAAGQPADFTWAMDDPNLDRQTPAFTGTSAPFGTNPAFRRNIYIPVGQQLGIPPVPPATSSPTSLVNDTYVAAPVSTPQVNPLPAPPGSFYVTPGVRPPVPSFPVLLDPVGFFTHALSQQRWIARASASANTIVLPRRNFSAPNTTAASHPNPPFPVPSPAPATNGPTAYRLCGLTDDMTFEPNGAPTPTLERQGRYTWAAMIQRPRTDRPTVAALTILVFDGRSPFTVPPADEVIVNPVSFVDVGAREVVVDAPNRGPDDAPLIRRGGWIMDGTVFTPPAASGGLTGPAAVRNAKFYRIVGVVDNPPGVTTTRYILELDRPFEGPVPVTSPLNPANQQFYLLAGLSEVFLRPPLQPDDQ